MAPVDPVGARAPAVGEVGLVARLGQGPAQVVIPAAVALDPVEDHDPAPGRPGRRPGRDVDRVAVGGGPGRDPGGLSHSGPRGASTVIRSRASGSTVTPRPGPSERPGPAAVAEGDVLGDQVRRPGRGGRTTPRRSGCPGRGSRRAGPPPRAARSRPGGSRAGRPGPTDGPGP